MNQWGDETGPMLAKTRRTLGTVLMLGVALWWLTAGKLIVAHMGPIQGVRYLAILGFDGVLVFGGLLGLMLERRKLAMLCLPIAGYLVLSAFGAALITADPMLRVVLWLFVVPAALLAWCAFGVAGSRVVQPDPLRWGWIAALCLPRLVIAFGAQASGSHDAAAMIVWVAGVASLLTGVFAPLSTRFRATLLILGTLMLTLLTLALCRGLGGMPLLIVMIPAIPALAVSAYGLLAPDDDHELARAALAREWIEEEDDEEEDPYGPQVLADPTPLSMQRTRSRPAPTPRPFRSLGDRLPDRRRTWRRERA